LSEEEARANALDRVLAALEGYNKAGRSLPRSGAGQSGADRVVLPSLVAAKLAVCGTMRARGWSKLKLATPLEMSDNAVRRLLDLRHRSQMWVVDAEMAKINAELPIDLPGPAAGGRAA